MEAKGSGMSENIEPEYLPMLFHRVPVNKDRKLSPFYAGSRALRVHGGSTDSTNLGTLLQVILVLLTQVL